MLPLLLLLLCICSRNLHTMRVLCFFFFFLLSIFGLLSDEVHTPLINMFFFSFFSLVFIIRWPPCAVVSVTYRKNIMHVLQYDFYSQFRICHLFCCCCCLVPSIDFRQIKMSECARVCRNKMNFMCKAYR